MGAIMINIFDQMPSVAFFKANADKLGQNCEMMINSLSALSSEKIVTINSPNFELEDLSENTFIENAKAYTFNYGGVDCAYLMVKVLSSSEESLWLAWELRQFKESWFFDFADITWLSLKVAESNGSTLVEELKLFPIALMTQFKDVEVNSAFVDFPFYKENISLLRKYSNWIEHCFDPKQSLSWLWTLSKFGYCLSQYSSEVLIHPNSGIKAKNQQLPFILNCGGVEYKALSLAIQVGSSDNDDCFWISTLFDSDNQMKTDGFILSYGNYPSDLPVRKLIAPNFVEESIFLKNDNECLFVVEKFLKSLMLEKLDIENYINVIKGLLATYLNNSFQTRLLYSCDFSEKVEVGRLSIDNQDSLTNFLESCDLFTSNLQMYQNTTSFPASMYSPNLDNSLIEDIPESLKEISNEESVDEVSIYDEQQPNFNTESRLGVMQHPKVNESYGSNFNYGKNSKRVLDTSPMAMNAKHARSSNIDDIDSAMDNNDRKKRNQKSQPVVVHRRRWGVLAKERREKIQEDLNRIVDGSSNDWDMFKQSVSDIDHNSIQDDVNGNSASNNFGVESIVTPDLENKHANVDNALTDTKVNEPTSVADQLLTDTKVNEPTSVADQLLTDTKADEPTSVADQLLTDTKADEPTSVIQFGYISISIGKEITVTLKPHDVVINYPKKLIENDSNYIFNNLIALGLDPYQSRDVIIAMNAPVKRYSYATITKMVKNASIDDLKRYNGFELYIDLVERELKYRS